MSSVLNHIFKIVGGWEVGVDEAGESGGRKMETTVLEQ